MNVTDSDRLGIERAYALARLNWAEGGLPIGAVLVQGGAVVAQGRNRLVRDGDPTAHGEIDCLRAGGRRESYAGTTLVTTLSPCPMCAGALLHFKVPRLVIGENRHAGGREEFLRRAGVEVVVLDDAACWRLVDDFISAEPRLWREDAG